MRTILNTRTMSYQEALKKGLYKEVSTLVFAFRNKVQKKILINLFDDVIEEVFKYFQQHGKFLTDKIDGRQLHVLEHNLQAALEALNNRHLFKNDTELFNIVFLLLIHNLPKEAARNIVEKTAIKYMQRFPDYVKKAKRYKNNNNSLLKNEKFMQDVLEYCEILPFDLVQGINLHERYSEYRNYLNKIISSPKYENITKAHFLYSRFRDQKEVLYMILFDTMAGIKYIAENDRREVASSYMTLKFLAMILENEQLMGSPSQKTLKSWILELQKAYFEIFMTPEEQEDFKKNYGISYFELYDLGKNFTKNIFVPFLNKKIEEQELPEDAYHIIEYRIKDPTRLKEKVKAMRNLDDIVGLRAVCKDMWVAYSARTLVSNELLSGKEDLAKFDDFFANPKKNGYRDVLQSTFKNVLNDLISAEIQFVGGIETNISNQRSEESGYLTVYASDLKLEEDLIFVNVDENCKGFADKFKGVFIKHEENIDMFDIIYQLKRDGYFTDVSKRMSAHIVDKDGLNFRAISFDSKRTAIKPGEVIVFSNKAIAPKNFEEELKKRHRLELKKATETVKR